MTVKNSTFTNNSVGNQGNGPSIWVDDSSTLYVENTTFTPSSTSPLSSTSTRLTSDAILDDDSTVNAALLDEVFVELEEEIELFF